MKDHELLRNTCNFENLLTPFVFVWTHCYKTVEEFRKAKILLNRETSQISPSFKTLYQVKSSSKPNRSTELGCMCSPKIKCNINGKNRQNLAKISSVLH